MRRENVTILSTVLVILLAAGGGRAQQHDHHGGSGETLGSVTFETSCRPETRSGFNRAVALLHSFEFRDAIAGFDQVLGTDPACAIAHWGRALAFWGNPFAPGVKGGSVAESGRAASGSAGTTGAPTPRERGYIEAVTELYRNLDPGTQPERVLAYARGMERVVRDNPGDMEATIFYALAVTQTALPTDKTYARQLEAVSLLDPLFAAHPDHPGLAHYIIHACDHPPLAGRALAAARQYARIAPSASHALHMPSHTFTRLGLWEETIDSNAASADVAEKAGIHGEVLHAMDYEMYAFLQTAQDAAARRVLERMPAIALHLRPDVVGGAAPPAAGYYARAAMPARFALERGDWNAAAALPVSPSPTPYADAITHFARAVGAARSGSPAAAAPDVRRLAELRNALARSDEPYWSAQVDIQRQAAEGWVAFASGRHDEGIDRLRAAAAAEEASDKAAVTPGPVAPAREMLGEMLLEAGRPIDALAAFAATREREPNRYKGLAGAARAGRAAGDEAAARGFEKRLLEICQRADTERPELRLARR